MPDGTRIKDQILIYWSTDDDAFVAHGINTDQMGMGPRVVDALAGAIQAIACLGEESVRDPNVTIYSPAPAEVRELFEQADELPKEIFEIAHKMAIGEWPDYLTVDLSKDESIEDFARRRFRAIMSGNDADHPEPAAA